MPVMTTLFLPERVRSTPSVEAADILNIRCCCCRLLCLLIRVEVVVYLPLFFLAPLGKNCCRCLEQEDDEDEAVDAMAEREEAKETHDNMLYVSCACMCVINFTICAKKCVERASRCSVSEM